MNQYDALKAKKADLESLNPETRQKMVDYLRVHLSSEDKAIIKQKIQENPETWYAPFHFFGGMGIRNLLRSAGFNEKRIGISNLDNVYVEIMEECVNE